MPQAASDKVPEGAFGVRAERPSPFSLAGFVIMLVAMAVEAIVLVILLKPGPIAPATQVKTGGEAATLTTAELFAPTVVMPEVIASVPVKEGEAELMTVVATVTIEIGRAEGRSDEELDLKYLEKAYVPKLQARMHEFKDKLISALSSSSYDVLRTADERDKLLEDLRKKMNATLGAYGVEKRVKQLYWNSFHFD